MTISQVNAICCCKKTSEDKVIRVRLSTESQSLRACSAYKNRNGLKYFVLERIKYTVVLYKYSFIYAFPSQEKNTGIIYNFIILFSRFKSIVLM